MRDYLIACLFLLVYEALSWPFRLALLPLPMSGDLRRVISRVAGPPTIAMVAWIFAHAGIPLGFAATWVWAILFGAGAYAICKAQGQEIRILDVILPFGGGPRWKRELVVEGIGLVTFFVYLAFRRGAPEMTSAGLNLSIGAEKFANATFFWSSWHARTLPPEDYWLAGNPQAYYYWGQFFWAWVGRAGGFRAEHVITLAMARVMMLTWESSYLLVRAFGARRMSAALGALLIAWGGNPQGAITAFEVYDYASRRVLVPEAERGFAFAPERIKTAWGNRAELLNYSYWNPSRVIANTVDEFPVWSAVLGDFHAHHLSLPWLIAWLAIVLRGDRWFGIRGNGYRLAVWGIPFVVLGLATTLANLWVAPLIALGSVWIFFWRFGGGARGWALRVLLIVLLGMAMLGGVLILRGSLSTPLPSEPGAAAQGFLQRLPVKILPHEIRSTFSELSRLWGFQAAMLVLASMAAAVRIGFRPLLVAGLSAMFVLGLLKLTAFPNEPAIYWICFAIGVGALGAGRRPWLQAGPLWLTLAVCCLLAGLELFYLSDRMVGELARYNSYFKFSYPVWPILSAAAWVGGARLWKMRWPRFAGTTVRVFLVAWIPFILAFALFGMPARNHQARGEDIHPRSPTLDAFAWLGNQRGYEAEGAMLEWIRANIPPGERVAELGGSDSAYNYYGRVASLGGRPVPLGWVHHEYQWRGDDATRLVTPNLTRVVKLYGAADGDALLTAAKELEVRWIVLGKNERDKLGEPRWQELHQTLSRVASLRFSYPETRPSVCVFEIRSGVE